MAPNRDLNILLVGDIIGRPGRHRIRNVIEQLKSKWPIDFVVANAENAAGGFGLTPDTARELFEAGIDVLTSGNHIYDKKEILPILEKEPRLLRPANYPPEAPGKGWGIYPTHHGHRIAVINLQGRILMPWIACPFTWIDNHLETIRQETPIIIVDFHAEATSEKNAMGWFLNERVTAVFGTHTHIPTADARVLPGEHTAYITDIGMTGPYNSVIGMDIKRSLRRLRTMFPRFLEVARGPTVFSGLLLRVDPETGRTRNLEHLMEWE